MADRASPVRNTNSGLNLAAAMFAKLKKKIQDEGSPGSISETDGRVAKLPSPGPGIASPVKLDFSGASPFRKDSARDFDTMSVSSEVSDVRDTTSKEDLLKKLMKKNEQIKKLEGKITDLAAMVREKNKNIEKLESSQEKLKQDTDKKLEELTAQLSEEKQRLEECNVEELNDKIKTLEMEKSKLTSEHSEMQTFKKKFAEIEEEREQMAGLATQELAKVKHLLLNTQADLTEKIGSLQRADKQVKELDSEVKSLMSQIGELTTRNEDLEEENRNNHAMLEQLQGIQGEVVIRNKDLKTAREELDKLHHSYDVVQKNSQVYQNKMAKLVEEKDEHISHLRERVETLEQRLKHGELSVDEQVTALQKERSVLEQKLSESREQLNEVKGSWSDKISHLETQIANLNRKIAEDNEELMSAHLENEKIKERFHKQVDDLQSQVERAEKECHKLEDKLRIKQTELEHMNKAHSAELLREKLHWTSLETELREKVTDLHKDIDTLHRTREHDKQTAQTKISQLEAAKEEWLEKEIDLEKQITKLEDKSAEMKQQLEEKERELEKRGHADTVVTEKDAQIKELQENIESLTEQVKVVQHELSDLDKEYNKSIDEKDSLLLRNAQLSQENESFKRKTRDQLSDLEMELQQKNNSVAGLEDILQEMQAEAKLANQKIHELENQQMVAVTEIESEEIKKLQKEIKDVEDQLLDRNKTIKKLQQRMTDLKKTLQRELNVQALPNDEGFDTHKDLSKPLNGPSPYPQSTHVPLRSFENHSNGDTTRTIVNSNSTPALPGEQAKFYAGGTDFSASDLENLMMPSSTAGRNKQKSTAGSKPGYSNFYAGVQYDRDINFDYLKHVILKFVLSRESEAVHLVKAVAVLLDFTPDEQKLIKETLEYKMSWFGSKPRLGQGQYSKFIPPPV